MKPNYLRPRPPYISLPHDRVEMDGELGWTTRDHCDVLIASGSLVMVRWMRPTTAHFFSRLVAYCDKCRRRIGEAHRVFDHFEGTLQQSLPCGAFVLPQSDSDEPVKRYEDVRLVPDYLPIESPRLFGLRTHGGAMRMHYDSFHDEQS